MARSIQYIQRDIELTRCQLASTRYQLADRSKPKNLVDDAKRQATARLKDPEAQKILLVSGAILAGLIVVGVLRSRKRGNDIKELQRLLAGRD